jgi:hypothetical protein
MPDEAQVEQDPLAVPAHGEHDQNRHPLAPLPDPHTGIPAVKEEIADVLGAQVPASPRLEVGREPSDEARDHVLAERTPAQQRGERALEPPRVPAAQVTPRIASSRRAVRRW